MPREQQFPRYEFKYSPSITRRRLLEMQVACKLDGLKATDFCRQSIYDKIDVVKRRVGKKAWQEVLDTILAEAKV